MSVTRTCQTNSAAIALNATAGEYLKYEIVADPHAEYVLTEDKQKLLDNHTCASPCTYEWKKSPPPTDISLTFGVVFLDAGKATLKVTKCDAGGAVLRTVKDCEYVNTNGNDDYYDALRVFLS